MTNADAVKTLAATRAAKLCSEALASIAKGRKVFVKGKPQMVAFGADHLARMKDLQLGAFLPGGQIMFKLDEAFGPMTEEDMAEAVALYCAAGTAEVERLWVVA